MKYLWLFVSLFLISLNLNALPDNRTYLYVQQHDNKPGMFSVFCSIAGFLDMYDKGQFAGLEVNFEEKGLYYDPSHGPNWWDYYCEPIRLGSRKRAEVRKFSEMEIGEKAAHTEFTLPKERVHELIQKYIKVKAHIQAKVDSFVEKHFKGRFVIGIHYRGTDKYTEAPRAAYHKVDNFIRECLKEGKGKKPAIFVATDEQQFLDHIIDMFPDRVFYMDAERSSNGAPVHLFSTISPYLKGEQALVDMLLLSRTTVLIRTSSNLSLWSTYFSPNLKVLEVNHRH